jgi:hypothetical protein
MKKTIFILSIIFTVVFTKNLIAQGTIVDVAISNKNFSTLVTALKAADLVGALQGDGPFRFLLQQTMHLLKLIQKP